MGRRAALVGLAALLAAAGGTACADESLRQALALEETIQKAAAKAEPSIACILVSRSEAYRKFDLRAGKSNVPGQLGDYQQPARFHGHSTELLARLNMSALDHVPDGYGSGVVIEPSGLILTNYHVVREATKIFVRLPGKLGWYANIHAADERSDLAVLKLINLQDRLPALTMADAGTLKKGQFVVALANPFAAGFRDGSPSVSWGLIGNLRRRVPGEPNEVYRHRPRLHYYGVLLQTDLRLNLGCSGGALLDLKGNWIGLTTAQAAVAGGDTAGGFATPFDARMSRIIDVLRRGEEVAYGFLGISVEQSESNGLYVKDVTSNGPASRAGLFGKEKIISIDGQPIHDSDDLFLNVGAALAGTEVRISVEQQGRPRVVKATLVKSYWPSSGPVIAANRPKPVLGLHVDYTSSMLRGLVGDATAIAPGVVVSEIVSDSPAAKAGLKTDVDIITEVNGRPVNSPKEFFDAAQGAGTLELTLAEGGRKVRLP